MPINDPVDLGTVRSAIDEGGAPWQMAYTSMTALTEPERVTRLGVPLSPGLSVDDLDKHRDDSAATRVASARTPGAPASFDLRSTEGANYATPVQDQGGCGSCVAFGTVAAMEHVARYTRRAPTTRADYSEAHLFYCHARTGGYGCATGWWPDLAATAARDTGVTIEENYPYTAAQGDCTGLDPAWAQSLAKVTAFETITGNAALMKEHIATYGSVVACFDVYQDFFSYGSGVYRHVAGDYAGGHCVCLVGYDDSRGCWIAKNSWGAGWGSGGYFDIAYGECRIEAYQTIGITGVALTMWLPDQRVLGLWTDQHDANVWAYGSDRGWLKLDGGDVATNHAMALQLAASKALGTPVGLYEDNGSVKQIYAW